jgi:hypothetical protein
MGMQPTQGSRITGAGQDSNWLAESDVTFISRNGPSEAESTGGVSDSEAETVQVQILCVAHVLHKQPASQPAMHACAMPARLPFCSATGKLTNMLARCRGGC